MPQPQIQPRLSLVALVRDEAENLRRLLSWHRALYDEAIVVDTGSTDDSVTVAQELGAEVAAFPWRDDFSAARNHGLRRARGDWILVLDCDEVLAPADFPAIKALCSGEPTGWCFEQRNYCAAQDDPRWQDLTDRCALAPAQSSGYVSNLTCRLFPRRDDVLYSGIVHEVPEPALRRAGIALLPVSLPIHHYGHLPTSDPEKKKLLYGKLLRKKLQGNPQDLRARREMAVQLVVEGQPALARRLLRRAVQDGPEDAESHPAHLLLSRLLAAEGQWGPAQAHVETAVRRWPALREGWVQAVWLHLRRRQLERAEQYLRQGRRLFPADAALRTLESRLEAARTLPGMAQKHEAADRILDAGGSIPARSDRIGERSRGA